MGPQAESHWPSKGLFRLFSAFLAASWRVLLWKENAGRSAKFRCRAWLCAGVKPSAAGSRFFLVPVHIASHPFEENKEAGADDDKRNEGFKTGHNSLFLPPAIILPGWKKRVICGISSVLFANCSVRPAIEGAARRRFYSGRDFTASEPPSRALFSAATPQRTDMAPAREPARCRSRSFEPGLKIMSRMRLSPP